MRTIETTATVAADRTLTIQLPEDIKPGRHKIILVIDESGTVGPADQLALDLPVHDSGPWPEGLSLSREELYDEWGR